MQKSGSQSELVKGTEHEVTKVAKFRKTEYKVGFDSGPS